MEDLEGLAKNHIAKVDPMECKWEKEGKDHTVIWFGIEN